MVRVKLGSMALLTLLLATACATNKRPPDMNQRQTTGYWQELHRTVPSAPLRTGKEVYDFRCRGCHGKNTQGAPMPGDHEAWQPRVAKGMDVLLDHAVHGYGQLMPAKGGCRNCKPEELRAAILYMINLPEIDFEAVDSNLPPVH